MARRKKLTRRNRLLRWAVPYLKNRTGSDRSCTGNDPPEDNCLRCEALRHLEDEDWEAIEFHDFVQDQFVNLEPMRADGKPPCTALRLEALRAACELLDVPLEDRLRLVNDARFLHPLLSGRDTRVWRPEMPTELPDLDEFELPRDSVLRAAIFDPRGLRSGA